ncbi:MAG: glycosyltransferase family 2 protein [Lachnospiraceae bacterium]|nr:glycosyltransferase family 2 protein [Lachnospiraceae bacterium]
MSEINISVAVATYNGEKYIKEQMDSILKNLSDKDEIVVSDDGSTDATLDILRVYQQGNIPVKIVKGPKMGIKQNIASALLHCRGKYIFLADQDDVWTENKVETVFKYLGKDGCMLVNHDAKVMNGSLTEVIMSSFFAYRGSKPGFWNNLWKNSYMGCCMAFDASLIKCVLPIPDNIEMHDQWIGMINDIRRGKSRFIDEKLLLYRRHDANVSDFSHGTVMEMLGKRKRLLMALWKNRKNIGKH